MRSEWKEEDITKALKNLARTEPSQAVYDRVWFNVEERVAQRQKHFLQSIVWRPWSHPIRWVAAAACMFVMMSGLIYHRDSVDKNELGAYLSSVSNADEGITGDPDLVRVSVLLSEASASASDTTMEYQDEFLSAVDIFL